MKMASNVKQIINKANSIAKEYKHEYVTPEHIFNAVLDVGKIKNILVSCGVPEEILRKEIKTYLEQKLPVLSKAAVPIETIGYRNIILRAEAERILSDKKEIDIADIIVSLFDEKDCFSSSCLRKAGIKRLKLLQALSYNPSEECFNSKYDRKYLDRFTVNLTAMAQENKLEPLIGREKELARTIQTLCRKKKNNPIFVGEAGVGKTAIIEGLAQRIASSEVPEILQNFHIYSLDMGAIVAGTRYRGTFEKRLKQVIDEISKIEKAILFIDEIHTIIGTGTNSLLDAANILKPILASGRFFCIGATTYSEYNKYFDKDHALSRRFQKIIINEPSEEETIEILKYLKTHYENYHNVTYTIESLESAVKLSSLYITDRCQPDKSIDLIDESGAYMRINAGKGNENIVNASVIEKLVSVFACIPEKTVSQNEKNILYDLESKLKEKIFGQDAAITEVVKAVKRSRAGLQEEGKPIANFLFVGPTGVGKTELACQLADILGIAMIRFDMSEYQEKYSVAKFIGSSPGYVGYEDGGQLTNAVRKQPYSVLLLDEIEKAHSDIYNTLLQVMDYATLTDNQGRKADFRNVILIMTSNAGAGEMGKRLIGFGDRSNDNNAVSNAVERLFAPEFRNRLDAVIEFTHLSKETMASIVRKQLDILAIQLDKKNVTLKISEICVNKLAEEGYSSEYGARNISRYIEEKIKSFFIDEILFGRLKNGGKVKVDWQNGRYVMELS